MNVNAVTVIDAINNKEIATVRILASDADILALDNTDGRIKALLDKTKTFKVLLNGKLDDCYKAIPIKIAGNVIVAKIIKSNYTDGRERRRYLRTTCELPTKITFNNSITDGTIKELAYGSITFRTALKLKKDDPIAIRVNELDSEIIVMCNVMAQKPDKNDDENSLWFEGFKYIAIIDEEASGQHTMDVLYSKIYRLNRELMLNEDSN